MKMTTGTKFESKLVSFSAEAELVHDEILSEQVGQLKEFVKEELKKEVERNKQ
jgi:hypothetical protein